MYIFTKSPYINEGIVFNSKQIERADAPVVRVWKPIVIKGYETSYEISTYGEVRDIVTGEPRRIYELFRKDRNTFYVAVTINVKGKLKKFAVHRLVAIAFIPIPKKYIKAGLTYKDLEVNHKDAHKWHNVITNLEWCTHDENMEHAKVNHLVTPPKGERHWLTKLSNDDVVKICELLQSGKNPAEVSRIIGTTMRLVQHIKAGDTWTSISKNYTFPLKEGAHSKPNTIDDSVIHGICKLLEERAAGKNKFPEQVIADKYGVSRQYVNLILRRKCKVEISKGYKF